MEGIELAFQQLRLLEQALADLREAYKQVPSQSLARMIANAEAEIADRAKAKTAAQPPTRCF